MALWLEHSTLVQTAQVRFTMDTSFDTLPTQPYNILAALRLGFALDIGKKHPLHEEKFI